MLGHYWTTATGKKSTQVTYPNSVPDACYYDRCGVFLSEACAPHLSNAMYTSPAKQVDLSRSVEVLVGH